MTESGEIMKVDMKRPPNAQLVITLGPGQAAHDLKDNINYYIRLSGLSQKEFVMRAIAERIGDNNPELVMQIAEHLIGTVKGRPKKGVSSAGK